MDIMMKMTMKKMRTTMIHNSIGGEKMDKSFMEDIYNKAFNNDKKAIKYWLDTFIDYLVCANTTIDVEVIAQALLDKLIGESVDNTITEIMIGILKTYI